MELGEHYGSLRTERRGNGIVLNLVRSRVPNRERGTADEFEWDLSEQEQPDDPEHEDAEGLTDESGDSDDEPNPNAEIIELPEDYHLPARATGSSWGPGWSRPGFGL